VRRFINIPKICSIYDYQQLQQFNSAEKAIQARLEKYNQGSLLVELAITFSYKKRRIIKFTTTKDWPTQENPNEVYGIASSFEKKLDYALKSYQIASDLEPKYNFNYQKAYFMVN
jgi:hypothetical protein